MSFGAVASYGRTNSGISSISNRSHHYYPVRGPNTEQERIACNNMIKDEAEIVALLKEANGLEFDVNKLESDYSDIKKAINSNNSILNFSNNKQQQSKRLMNKLDVIKKQIEQQTSLKDKAYKDHEQRLTRYMDTDYHLSSDVTCDYMRKERMKAKQESKVKPRGIITQYKSLYTMRSDGPTTLKIFKDPVLMRQQYKKLGKHYRTHLRKPKYREMINNAFKRCNDDDYKTKIKDLNDRFNKASTERERKIIIDKVQRLRLKKGLHYRAKVSDRSPGPGPATFVAIDHIIFCESQPQQVIQKHQQVIQKPQQVIQKPQQVIQKPQQVIQKPQQVIQKPQQVIQQPKQNGGSKNGNKRKNGKNGKRS